MEADQRSWVGKTRGVDAIQQLHDVSGFVAAEAIAAGFELSELAIESVRGHGDSRQGYLMACLRSVTWLMTPGLGARPDGRGRPSLQWRIVHLFLTRRLSTVNLPVMGAP